MTARATLTPMDRLAEHTDPDLFADHLRANARRYYPELPEGPVVVSSSGGSLRPASVLYEFELQVGAVAKPVLVKMPLVRASRSSEPSAEERPRLVMPTPSHEKFILEHEALGLIHDHFARLGDPRFGTVRPLDLLPARRALVMEKARGASMRALCFARPDRGGAGPALEDASNGAGAWLRVYHELDADGRAVPRHTRRTDHTAFVARLAEFLGELLREREFFQDLASAHAGFAAAALPDLLPLALGHGDFAPRNVLVEPGGRVTVLDTLARYRVPVYEDIGYFLTSLRCGWRQVLSLEAAIPAERISACERAFLAGYFGDDQTQYRAVRSYEIQAMLDLWAASAWRHAHAAGHGARFTERVKLSLLSRLVRRRVEEALR